MSTHTFTVTHHAIPIPRPFDEVVARLQGSLGRFELSSLASQEQARQRLEALQGADGLLLFGTVDHGALLATVKGKQRKVLQFVIGNPLIAVEMTQHDVGAALYAPLRMLVYEDGPGTTIEYDQPSTLFGQSGSPEVGEVARKLDQKLQDLVASLV